MSIKEFISEYTVLTQQEWQGIEACFSRRTIQRGELILEQDKICRHLYFLEEGLMRYFVNDNGNDVTKYFTIAPYMFTSQRSFTTSEPSKENIEAIEDGVVWEITRDAANNLLVNTAWNTFVRTLVQEVQFYTENVLFSLQTKTAEQRYVDMMEKEAELLHRVPLKYLASYFGIAPQSLSRIRKNILKS